MNFFFLDLSGVIYKKQNKDLTESNKNLKTVGGYLVLLNWFNPNAKTQYISLQKYYIQMIRAPLPQQTMMPKLTANIFLPRSIGFQLQIFDLELIGIR